MCSGRRKHDSTKKNYCLLTCQDISFTACDFLAVFAPNVKIFQGGGQHCLGQGLRTFGEKASKMAFGALPPMIMDRYKEVPTCFQEKSDKQGSEIFFGQLQVSPETHKLSCTPKGCPYTLSMISRISRRPNTAWARSYSPSRPWRQLNGGFSATLPESVWSGPVHLTVSSSTSPTARTRWQDVKGHCGWPEEWPLKVIHRNVES